MCAVCNKHSSTYHLLYHVSAESVDSEWERKYGSENAFV